MAQHRVDVRDAGAGRWVAGRESGPPTDRPMAAAERDDAAQRSRQVAPVPHPHDTAVGLELAAVPDHVAERISGVAARPRRATTASSAAPTRSARPRSTTASRRRTSSWPRWATLSSQNPIRARSTTGSDNQCRIVNATVCIPRWWLSSWARTPASSRRGSSYERERRDDDEVPAARERIQLLHRQHPDDVPVGGEVVGLGDLPPQRLDHVPLVRRRPPGAEQWREDERLDRPHEQQHGCRGSNRRRTPNTGCPTRAEPGATRRTGRAGRTAGSTGPARTPRSPTPRAGVCAAADEWDDVATGTKREYGLDSEGSAWTPGRIGAMNAPLSSDAADPAVLVGAEPMSHVAADPSAAGVLTLHGFTGNPSSMRGVAEAFAAAGYHVELPRLPGHGTTIDEMLTTTWADWSGEAEAAFQRLGRAHRSDRHRRALDGRIARAVDGAASPRRPRPRAREPRDAAAG